LSLTKFTSFTGKKNAAYEGDPQGSYIMAEDINLIQDSVTQLEQAIGLHNEDLTLTERITRVEQNAALKAEKFIVYEGDPLLAYATTDEAIDAFSFVEHLALQKQVESAFPEFISQIQKAKTNVYGYIDTTSMVSLSQIQLDIEYWRGLGAVGIYLANFDYENGNTRTRQNDILSSVHERGLRAIVEGDYNSLLFNTENPASNPDWLPLDLKSTDGYHMFNAFVQFGTAKDYDTAVALAKDLIKAKEELGISIYIEDTANGADTATQGSYEHGHMLALLFGLDGYFLTRTDYYQLNDPIRYHAWAPFLGAYAEGNITLVETDTEVRRRTSFGEIVYTKADNVIQFSGLTIPPEIMQWKDNSLSGAVIKDSTIEDKKIKSYDGDRLVDAINNGSIEHRIGLNRLSSTNVGDMSGTVTVDQLKANVIEAININAENLTADSAHINSAVITNLTADKIQASVIEAINISAGHLEAGSAYIHGAIIDDLDAGSISTGSLDADIMNANVIAAINANFGHAEIDSAVIGVLKADRMQANVINAINLYAKEMKAGDATIDTATIGSLKAENIQASVISAINANINVAKIDKAIIPELDAGHIQASVIDALKANIGSATIDSALIGVLDAKSIQTNVISAINANINVAKIDKAIIPELDASHISTNVMKALEANIGVAKINSALIGDLTADSMKAHIVEAINFSAQDATIEGAKIKDATIDSAKITKGTITSAEIADATIDTANIKLGAVTSAIIGEGQVDTINIATAAITDALIKNLSADKIDAGTINTDLIKIQGDNGFLRLWQDRLQVFDNQTVPVERVSVGDVNGDGTQFGFRVRGVDGQTVLYDEHGVYNEGITDGAITNPKIGDDAVDGRVIKANSVFAEHIVAGEIKSDAIATNAIITKHILAGSITAESGILADAVISRAKIADAAIGAAQIDVAVIGNAHIKDLNADKITAGKVKAQFLQIDGTSTFADGYNPMAINTNIRNDLHLTSPLPSNITLNGNGIKVTTASDPTQYVSLDYRGLYVHNGAIIIDGGLSKDNIDPAVTNQWDAGAQFAADMANDDIVTPSEKSVLGRDYKAWEAEYASLLAQADWYWPDNTTAPVAKTDYIDKYGQLRTYLTATNDLNNLRPILYASTMMQDSQIVGTELNGHIDDYKNAAYTLQQELSIAAKKAADNAQQNVDDVENNIVYKLEVSSSNGNQFINGQISTSLEARVWHGSTEVTDQFPDYKFQWTRVSNDPSGDTDWNARHFSGMRVIQITKDDVYVRATFNCELLD
jgi:hypothetical protein